MEQKPEKLLAALPVIYTDGEDGRDIKPMAFIIAGQLLVSNDDGEYFIDYYGEVRCGEGFIHPKLQEFAEKHGGYWEWRDPGCVVLQS